MFDPNWEPSAEEIKTIFSQFAKTAVKLLSEKPAEMTHFETNREIELGITEDVYVGSVQMKNALTGFFATMADGLIENDNWKPFPIFSPDGKIDRAIIGAISWRCSINMDFPEFTIPFGEALKELVKASPFVTKRWQLVDGEGKGVSFQAIGEKIPLRVCSPRRRAVIVKVPISLPKKEELATKRQVLGKVTAVLPPYSQMRVLGEDGHRYVASQNIVQGLDLSLYKKDDGVLLTLEPIGSFSRVVGIQHHIE